MSLRLGEIAQRDAIDHPRARQAGAAVRLQTDSQSLQISFASIAKISQLSLLNYP